MRRKSDHSGTAVVALHSMIRIPFRCSTAVGLTAVASLLVCALLRPTSYLCRLNLFLRQVKASYKVSPEAKKPPAKKKVVKKKVVKKKVVKKKVPKKKVCVC